MDGTGGKDLWEIVNPGDFLSVNAVNLYGVCNLSVLDDDGTLCLCFYGYPNT